MFDADAYLSAGRAWVSFCGDPGPYAVRRPTPGHPGRLEVLRYTRPAGHDGELHQYADISGVVIASWDRAGRPHFPPVIEARRSENA